MTRRVFLFFSVLLAVVLLFACAGMAENEPVVGVIELTPAYLTGPGPVSVTITISNATNEDFKDPVVLYNPAAQIVSDFGTDGEAMLKAGESLSWTGDYDVNQRTLDNGFISYFLKYTSYRDSGEAVEQNLPLRAKIGQQSAQAAIEVKRTITPAVAQKDQKVSVTYHITNAGTVSLTNITITENKDVYAKSQTIPELGAGKVAEITYPVTMGTKNLTSGATITYVSEGSTEEKTYVVEDQIIAYGTSDLTAKLTASSKGVVQNGVLTLTLDLENKGSVDFSDIRVTDPKLGDVFTNQQLAAGKKLKLDKEITLTETTDYQFTVTAIDSTGTESTTATEPVTVTAVNPEDALNLTLLASPDKTEVYGNPGIVHFLLTITNDSNVDASDVKISHGDTAIHTFLTIPAGESRTLNRDTALSMSGKFQFTAQAADPLENTLTFKSNEMQIAVYAPTPEPVTPTPAPNPTPEPTFQPATFVPIRDPSIGAAPKTIQQFLLPILIIAGVLMFASLGLLLVASVRRAKQKKASEAAYDHLERAKRRDYVTPAEPEEEAPQADEKIAKPEEDEDDDTATLVTGAGLVDDSEPIGSDDWELPHMKYAQEAADVHSKESASSPMEQGLYDDDLSNELDGFTTEGYDAPYDHPAYDSAEPTEEAEAPAETDGAYEDDGYTDELQSDYAADYAEGSYEEPQEYDSADPYEDDSSYYDAPADSDNAEPQEGEKRRSRLGGRRRAKG